MFPCHTSLRRIYCTKKIFLNTTGTDANGVSEILIHFLRYVEESTDSYVDDKGDAIIKQLHGKIKELKKYCKAEGQAQMLTLIKKMTEDGAHV